MTTRPRYPVDTEAEADVASELANAWGCRFLRLPQYSRVDWLGVRDGSAVAIVEIKCRTHGPGHYPTLMVSATKWLDVRSVASCLMVPGLLVVRFGDRSIRYADLNLTPVADVAMGGRTDRGDPMDLEPCVFLPVAAMGVVV